VFFRSAQQVLPSLISAIPIEREESWWGWLVCTRGSTGTWLTGEQNKYVSVKLGEQAPVLFDSILTPFKTDYASIERTTTADYFCLPMFEVKNSPSVQAKIFLPEEVSALISHPRN
jgi:hypothetical protein